MRHQRRLEPAYRPRVRTVVDVLRTPALVAPDEVAIHLLEHDDGKVDPITYADLWDSVCGVAGRLQAEGLKPGDTVLVILPTSRAFIETFFGIMAAGAIPVPLSPPVSIGKLEAYRESLKAIAADCGASACVSNSKLLLVLRDVLLGVNPRLRTMTPVDGAAEQPIGTAASPDPDDVAFLQYTSGSTSLPKGVVLSHGNLVANVDAIRRAASISAARKDVVVSWLPLFHDMGLIGSLIGTLYFQVPLVLMSPEDFLKDPARWLRAISNYEGTITPAPNFAFGYAAKRVKAEEIEGVRLDSLRLALNGAEPVDFEAIDRFQARFGAYGLRQNVVRPVYGLAESSLAVTFTKPETPLITDEIDSDILERTSEAQPPTAGARGRVLCSVGHPIHSQELRIVDADDHDVTDRHVGEVLVRGPSVMQGYYHNEEASAKALKDGWLHTGDYGYVAGGELYITGRKKDLIIRRGRNYYPQDLELLLARVDGVRKGRVIVFGIEKDSDTQLIVCAETCVRDEAKRAKMVEEICAISSRAWQFPPSDVLLVPNGTIPRTSSGKVRRQPARALYLEGRLTKASTGKLTLAGAVAKSIIAWAKSKLSGVKS